MSLKRPPPRVTAGASTDSSNTSASQSALAPAAKRRRTEPGFLHGQKVLIYQRDLPFDPQKTEEMMELVAQAGGKLCSAVETADLIITRIADVSRLKNSLTPEDVAGKRVVHWKWLRESVGLGVAQSMGGKYELVLSPTASASRPRSSSPVLLPAAPASRQTGSMANPVVTVDRALMIRPPTPRNVLLSCQRWTPMHCPNDDLIAELQWIHRARWLGIGDKPGCFDSNQLAYARAIAHLKTATVRIQTKHLVKLRKGWAHIGDKMIECIKQFIKTGRIEEAERAKNDRRLLALIEFNKIFGVGGATAHDKENCRTMADVERVTKRGAGYGFDYLADVSLKIPRSDVEAIGAHVNEHLQLLAPGTRYTICGGYRRGKPASNDVDIIFTHDDDRVIDRLLEKLETRMRRDGSWVGTLTMATPGSKRIKGGQSFPTAHRTSGFDSLDKALIVYKHRARDPTTGVVRDIHRRVDLIACYKRYYPTAIVGWTGGLQFERDIRIKAKQMGLVFDSSGIYRESDNVEIFARDEQDVFKILGLDYVPPEFRCTDP